MHYTFIFLLNMIYWILISLGDWVDEHEHDGTLLVVCFVVSLLTVAGIYVLRDLSRRKGCAATWREMLIFVIQWVGIGSLFGIGVNILVIKNHWIVYQEQVGWENFLNGIEYAISFFGFAVVPSAVILLYNFGRWMYYRLKNRVRKTTLCYLEKDMKYLMLHRIKKEKDINRDKWIGVGGHFEPGETAKKCLLREVREETGLTLTNYRLRGIVTFICDRWETEQMYLYTAAGVAGEMIACSEGELEWVDKEAVCNLPIWQGDKLFFELLAEEAPFFSLILHYRGDTLARCILNGREKKLNSK